MISSTSRTPASASRVYYPFIDGLRALAVLSVLIFHLNGPWLPGGFVGVDVFFVISGFVVSASVADFRGRGLWQFLVYFYARRIRRIFPALIACLLATAWITALFIPSSWLSAFNARTGLYAFFGLSNFILTSDGRDYFAPTTDFNPYTHTWSLAVEEQFYLVFPFLFLVWLGRDRSRRISMALFAAALLASLGFAAWQSQANPTAAYFLTPSRFWELAAGVLLYQIEASRRVRAPEAGEATVPSVVGALSLLLLVGALCFSRRAGFPFPGALPAVLGTAGVIWCLYRHPDLRRLHALLGNGPLVLVGRISYSLYLWHWPVFVLFRWTCGLDTPGLRALAVVAAFVLALASWRFIENPVRHSQRLRRFPQAGIIALGLAVIGSAALAASDIADNVLNISLSTVSRHSDDWYPHGASTSANHPGCTADPEYHQVNGGLLMIYSPKGCVTPPTMNPHSLYVIGDSHALAYEGMFRQYAIRYGTRVFAYNNGGCPFISLQPWRDNDDAQCRQYTAGALQDLRGRIQPGDVLFLASLRLPRFSDQWAYFGVTQAHRQMFSLEAQTDRAHAVKDAVQTLKEFTDKGVQVVFEAPKPIFRAPPFRCADWFNRHNPICQHGFTESRTDLLAYRQPVLDAFTDISRQLPNVSTWDPFPTLCPSEKCTAWLNGEPLFLDGDHISGHANALLLPNFASFITKIEKNGEISSNSQEN